MAESATFALKAGVRFRRGRLLIISPDSLGTACPLSGRNSTYRPVQISAAGSALRGTAGEVSRRNISDGRAAFAEAAKDAGAHPLSVPVKSDAEAGLSIYGVMYDLANLDVG